MNQPYCIWINPDLLDDPEIQSLPTEEFGRLFHAAALGEDNILRKWMLLEYGEASDD